MDKTGVSPIISTILIISIVMVVIASLLQWGVPTIQYMQVRAQFRSSLGQFNILDDTLQDLIREGTNATRTTRISIGQGGISFRPSAETWEISYYNATGQEVNSPPFNTGVIEQEINSPFGRYVVRESNNAILTQEGEHRLVRNPPFILERKGESIIIYLINLSGEAFAAGEGNYEITFILLQTKLLEVSEDVTNLTLKISGNWTECWYGYFEKELGFERKGEGIIYREQIKLTLVQCNVDVKLEYR